MADIRQSLIRLELPTAPDAEPPICKWCGERIEYTDIATPRHRQRHYHRGDKYERGVGGGDWPTTKRNCRRELKQSFCWSGRDALRWQAWRNRADLRRYILACADCGEVVEEGRLATGRKTGFYTRDRKELKRWEADHEHPIIDGGAHVLENLECRCTGCHSIKTKLEAQLRAARR